MLSSRSLGWLCLLAACHGPETSRQPPFFEEGTALQLRVKDEIAIRTAVVRALPHPCCDLARMLIPSMFLVDTASSLPIAPQSPRNLLPAVLAALTQDDRVIVLAVPDSQREEVAYSSGLATVEMSPLYRWERSDTVMVAVILRTAAPPGTTSPDMPEPFVHLWYLLVPDDQGWRVGRLEAERQSKDEVTI